MGWEIYSIEIVVWSSHQVTSALAITTHEHAKARTVGGVAEMVDNRTDQNSSARVGHSH